MSLVGYILFAACALLIWAGVTDQNPINAVQSVLSGKPAAKQ